MSLFLAFVVGLIAYLLILGTVTMLAAWLISGHRTSIWSAIKANFFFGLAVAVMGFGAIAATSALSLHLPTSATLAIGILLIIMGFIVIPCWVFAHYLEISTLQAFAVLLLLWAISTAAGVMLEPRLPENMRPQLPKTQMTQTLPSLTDNNHA